MRRFNFLALWRSLKWFLAWAFPGVTAKGSCRFYPTCSVYAQQAIREYGMIHGIWLAAKRLLRCHPFSNGGYDPVR